MDEVERECAPMSNFILLIGKYIRPSVHWPDEMNGTNAKYNFDYIGFTSFRLKCSLSRTAETSNSFCFRPRNRTTFNAFKEMIIIIICYYDLVK